MKKFFFELLLVFLFQSFFYANGIWVLYFFNKAILVLSGIVIFCIFILFALKRNRIHSYTLYFLFWFFILDFSSAVSAFLHFKQPILYGLIAQIKLLAYTFYFIALFVLSKFQFSYRMLENIFAKVAVILLVVFYIIAVFLKGFLEGTQFLKYDLVRGWRLNLPLSIVIIGYFYYLHCFFYMRRKIYLLFPLAVLLFLILYEKIRMITIGLLVITTLAFLRSSFGKLMKFLVISIIVIIITIVVININVQSIILHSSLAIRLVSAEIIWSTLQERNQILNVLLGVGGLNRIFFKSFQFYFGQNFWPSDVGLLGIFFEFGILGIVFVVSLWIILLREIKKAKILFKNGILISAFEDYIYLSILLSPLNPMIIYQLGVFSTMLGILVYLNKFYCWKLKLRRAEYDAF